jgi:hypothetical protein
MVRKVVQKQKANQNVNVKIHIGDKELNKKKKKITKKRPKKPVGGANSLGSEQRLFNPVYIQSGNLQPPQETEEKKTQSALTNVITDLIKGKVPENNPTPIATFKDLANLVRQQRQEKFLPKDDFFDAETEFNTAHSTAHSDAKDAEKLQNLRANNIIDTVFQKPPSESYQDYVTNPKIYEATNLPENIIEASVVSRGRRRNESQQDHANRLARQREKYNSSEEVQKRQQKKRQMQDSEY